MAEPSRYNTSDDAAGIEDGVLKNKLEIKDNQMLSDLETVLLKDTYTFYLNKLHTEGLVFDRGLIFELHKYFLGTLYSCSLIYC